MKLFRPEAIEYQKSKLLGDVVLNIPANISILVIVLTSLISLTIYFLASQEYRHKESVTGFIAPKDGLTTITSDKNLTIASILIQPGNKVKKGDLLIKIDTNRVLANGTSVANEYEKSFDREIYQIEQQLISEEQLQNLRQSRSATQIKKLDKDVTLLGEEIHILSKAKGIKNDQLSAVTQMVKRGYGAQTEHSEEELKLLEYTQRMNDAEMALATKKQELDGLKIAASQEALQSKQTLSDLTQRKEQILQQKININSQETYAIRSPIDGTVSTIYEHAGSNVLPGMPILAIQPNNSELIARLAVPSRSIGLVKKNQQVSIYYEAFPYQRFGVYRGNVSKIFLDTINPKQFIGPIEMSEAFYMVEVDLDKKSVLAYGQNVPLLAGMKLSAEITLESDSLIGWLLSPIKAISQRYE